MRLQINNYGTPKDNDTEYSIVTKIESLVDVQRSRYKDTKISSERNTSYSSCK